MFYELTASTWDDEEISALHRVINSGQFTMAGEVAAFEREFAAYFDMPYAVMVNSGSSANLAGVAALFYKKDRPLQPGDEIIVPAISWSTTYHPLQQYGLKLRFVDIDLTSLNMDVTQLEAALTPRTRMIMAVSILGNPAALDVIKAFAEQHHLYVFEDNCESMDAELHGRKTGTFGDINTFSFFFSHHISTMEGGMVLVRDPELFQLLRAVRAHGWTRDLPADSLLFQRRDDSHFEQYRFILPGYNLRPLEFSGATGRVQLKKLPGFTTARRRNAETFKALFQDDDRFIIQQENGTSSAFSFTIILNPTAKIDRTAVFSALREAEIGFRVITGGCFTRHDVIKYYDYETVGTLPNANLAHDQGFFVGNHAFDLTPQLQRLHLVLDQCCQ